jgi:hypothetical protein
MFLPQWATIKRQINIMKEIFCINSYYSIMETTNDRCGYYIEAVEPN